MSRIDWRDIPRDTKESIFREMTLMNAPCNWEGVECPMEKYGIDCDKDNDNHCAFRDFIFNCVEVKEKGK